MSVFGNTGAPSGGSIFGNTTTNASQQPQQSGGLFGNTTTTQPSGGLFGGGNTSQQQQPSGGLFGNTGATQQQQQPSGGLFGSATASTGQQQPASGGLFGNTSTNTAQPSGGLFGSTNTGGQQQPSGSLFGNTNTNTGTQPTGSLFGSANTNTNAAAQPSGGLFGNTTNTTNTNQPSGGLFGSANTTTNTSQPSGSLFGSTNTNTTGQPSGSLFGSTSTATQGTQPSGSLFGSTNTNTSNPLLGGNTGGSLFGGPKPAGSLFGSTNTTTNTNTNTNPLFGGSSTLGQSQQQSQQNQQQQKPAGPLFANLGQSTAPAGGSTLGLSTTGTGGGATAGVGPEESAALQKRIDGIYQAWNGASPQCQFQHYFYNLVDPNQVRLYGRPPNATDDARWERAVRENPDPSCMVPVLAVGFDDLQQRVDAQAQEAAMHRERIKDLQSRLSTLSTSLLPSSASRLARLSAAQTLLTQRLLRAAQHLHLLLPALRASALRPEEEAMRGALDQIAEGLGVGPGGRGGARGRMGEMWARVGALQAREGSVKGDEWKVVDEEGLERIAMILSEQQAGLAHLTKILQRDQRDLGIILGTKGEERAVSPGAVDERIFGRSG